MNIYINDKIAEAHEGETLITVLRREGYYVPSLCYADGAKHQASCMVCMVKNLATGQMVPSCSTYPVEGMRIETDTEEVLSLRRMSLELLLSDHRADCEAPCTIVCPHKLDPAQILLHYDRGQMAEAHSLLMKGMAGADTLPCGGCKAPCEKACRRGTVDKAVTIRYIMAEVAACTSLPEVDVCSKAQTDKTVFGSKLGRYTDEEKEWLKTEYADASRCLHCACEGRDKCKLRECATHAGIKSPRFGVSSALPVKVQHKVVGNLCYEPAKCIRCGLCIYNTEDGFTFQNRGFVMQVMIPEESREHVSEAIAKLCPTGALFTAP